MKQDREDGQRMEGKGEKGRGGRRDEKDGNNKTGESSRVSYILDKVSSKLSGPPQFRDCPDLMLLSI